MKKYIFLLFVSFVSQNIFSQNIDEILTKYETANGGKEAFASVKTLQYSTAMKMNMMGMPIDISISNIAETNKLYRKEMSGMMGMKGSYTLVTDTVGYVFMPTVPSFGEFQGLEGGLKKMEKDVLAKAQQKLDPMKDFSALIDCIAKGSKAELLGTYKVEKVECYKIKLTTKEGDAATYYIDISTMLIKQVELAGKQIVSQLGLDGGPMSDMLGGRVEKQRMTVVYSEYKVFKGIKFPTKQKIQFGAVDIEIENSDIEINEPIDKKWYSPS